MAENLYKARTEKYELPSVGRDGWRAAAAAAAATLRPAADTAKNMTKMESAAQGAASAMKAAASAAAKTAAATAKAAASAARYTASFDELEKLPAAKTAGSGSKSGSSKGKNAGAGAGEDGAAQLSLWDRIRAAAAQFWAWWKSLTETGRAAWAAAWKSIRETAAGAWTEVSAAAATLWQGTLQPFLTWLAGVFAPGIYNTFSTAMAPIVSGVLTTMINAFATAFQTGCTLIAQAVSGVVVPALSLLLTIWNGMMAGISAAWTSWGQPILDGVTLGVQNLMLLVTNLWQSVLQPVLTAFLALVESLWNEHLLPLWNQALQLLGAGQTMVLNYWNNILLPFLNWMTQSFGPLVAQVLTVAGQAATFAAALMSDAARVILTALTGVADFMSNVFAGNWAAAWESVRATVDNVWASIQSLVRTAVNGVIGLVNGMLGAVASGINAVADALNSLSFTVPGWVPGLGGSHIGFSIGHVAAPQIPMLASGGVIRRPTLAMMGEYAGAGSDPEIAAPQSAIAQAVSEANGDVVDAVLTAAQQIIEAIRENGGEIIIGDEVIGRAARRYNDRRAIMTGGVV